MKIMLTSGNDKILIIAPHADDEILGCGGLIEKATRLGNKVKVILGAVGNTHFLHTNKVIPAQTRKEEFIEAINYLGCTDFELMYEDKETEMDTIPQRELIDKLESILTAFLPSMVFIPYPSFNQDHRALYTACITSLRPRPDRKYSLIACYEYPLIVWNKPGIINFDHSGELYLDISDTIDAKIEALKKHKSQLRDKRHLISPEMVKLWAEKRGMENGVQYAEKYHLLHATIL